MSRLLARKPSKPKQRLVILAPLTSCQSCNIFKSFCSFCEDAIFACFLTPRFLCFFSEERMETANKQLAAKECDDTEDNRKTISQLLAQSEDPPPTLKQGHLILRNIMCNILSNDNGHLLEFLKNLFFFFQTKRLCVRRRSWRWS